MNFLSNKQQSIKRDIFSNIYFAPNIFQRRTRAFETRSTTFSVFSKHMHLRHLDIYVSHTYRIFNSLRQRVSTSAIIIFLSVDFSDVHGGVIALGKREFGNISTRNASLEIFFFFFPPSIPPGNG